MLSGQHTTTFWLDLRPAPQNELFTNTTNPAMNPWYGYHRSKGEPTITILLNRHCTKLPPKYFALLISSALKRGGFFFYSGHS